MHNENKQMYMCLISLSTEFKSFSKECEHALLYGCLLCPQNEMSTMSMNQRPSSVTDSTELD